MRPDCLLRLLFSGISPDPPGIWNLFSVCLLVISAFFLFFSGFVLSVPGGTQVADAVLRLPFVPVSYDPFRRFPDASSVDGHLRFFAGRASAEPYRAVSAAGYVVPAKPGRQPGESSSADGKE